MCTLAIEPSFSEDPHVSILPHHTYRNANTRSLPDRRSWKLPKRAPLAALGTTSNALGYLSTRFTALGPQQLRNVVVQIGHGVLPASETRVIVVQLSLLRYAAAAGTPWCPRVVADGRHGKTGEQIRSCCRRCDWCVVRGDGGLDVSGRSCINRGAGWCA